MSRPPLLPPLSSLLSQNVVAKQPFNFPLNTQNFSFTVYCFYEMNLYAVAKYL
jgi:hypothetical protein